MYRPKEVNEDTRLVNPSRSNIQTLENPLEQTGLKSDLEMDNHDELHSRDYATEVKTMATCALLAALAVSSSTALLIIPNVEMMTLILFITGYRYGIRAGISTTLVAIILYEMIVTAFFGWLPLVTLAKTPAYLLVTIIGSILGQADQTSLDNIAEQLKTSQNTSLVYGTIGLLLTLGYDLLTTLAFGISSFGFDLKALAVVYFLGLPFTIVHEASNFMLFFWFPAIIQAMDNVEGMRRAGA